MKSFFRNLRKQSDFGLVLDWDFHAKNRWVSAYTPYLVNAIIMEFDPIIIDSQLIYNLKKKDLKYILSFEPGIQSPRIKYDTRIKCKKGIIYSDPHFKPTERRRYFDENRFSFVFSLYKTPFFKHFVEFPKKKFVHWPWAVPDQFISTHPIEVRSNEVAIFGGSQSDAYDVRNWCRKQTCISSYQFSGVENKELSDEAFYKWLSDFDAVVAAGSSDPKYDLVTPKYFEVAAAGALLFGQHCADLAELGFDKSNAVIFQKEDFVSKVEKFRSDPGEFLVRRQAGRDLVRARHKLSDRIRTLRETFYEH